MFIFHFHTIFVMTYYVNISVIDTLIHVGRIKMLHKHTHLPLCALTVCVTGHWDWTVFDLQAQKYLNWLRSSDPNMVTDFCHHWFRYWVVIVLVPAIAWTNDDTDILSIGTLEINLCEIILRIQIVCVVEICWKMLSAKQWPFCSGLDVLNHNLISHPLSF